MYISCNVYILDAEYITTIHPWPICYKLFFFKGTDRLCKVVKLSMQCSGQILSDSFETYKTFSRSVNPEFERKFDVQNHEFGWVHLQICFLSIK